MKITIEIANYGELEKLLFFLKSLDLKMIKVVTNPALELPIPTITKGDKNIDPTDLFGIWQAEPRSLEQVRESAWKRN